MLTFLLKLRGLKESETDRWRIQRGFRGFEPPFEAKLFHFHGDLFEKLGKTNKTNPFVNLNPLQEILDSPLQTAPLEKHRGKCILCSVKHTRILVYVRYKIVHASILLDKGNPESLCLSIFLDPVLSTMV